MRSKMTLMHDQSSVMSSVNLKHQNRYGSQISGYAMTIDDSAPMKRHSKLYLQTFFNAEEELRPRRSPIKGAPDFPYISESPPLALSKSPTRKTGLMRYQDSRITLGNSSCSQESLIMQETMGDIGGLSR